MELFSRNLGIISQEDQSKIESSHVLICGVGGMGGVCAEMLVRMGVGELTIIDPDTYEHTNTNRQIHCNQESIGKFKAEVLAREFLKINPKLKITYYTQEVGVDNVDLLVHEGVDIVVNGMDQFLPSLILERKARSLSKTIVDAWITPFASVFVITPEDPHWEDFLNLPTKGKKIEDITAEDLIDNLKQEVAYTLSHFKPYKYVDKELVNKVLAQEIPRPSFAPVVWLSGAFLANEVFKILCGYPHTDYRGIFFDQYDYKIVKGKLN